MKLQASAAILAGGKNTRNKGFPKVFELVDGQKLIKKQLEVLELLFDDIMIVAAKDLEFDPDCSHRIIEDIIPCRGPLGGIHSALFHAKNNSVFIIAGDMPWPDADVIKKMWNKFSKSKIEALIPSHERGREPLYAFYAKNAIVPVENCLKNNPHPRIICILNYIQYEEMHFDSKLKCFENINSFR